MNASGYCSFLACFLLLFSAAPGCGAERRENSDNAGAGAVPESVSLPAPRSSGPLTLEEVLSARRSRRNFLDEPLSLQAAAQLLWAAQGVTEPGRGLRTAPSAGATYPLETFLVAGRVEDLPAGVYRYRPAENTLKPVRAGDRRVPLAEAALGQRMVARAPAVIVFAAVHERTAARYGERAERYISMEVGHAGQNVYLQAEALGLGTVAVGAFRDGDVRSVLGISEAPLYLMPVGPVE